MKTLAFTNLNNYLITYHSTENPTPDEWEKYFGFYLSLISRYDNVIQFVLSDGGGLTIKQRKHVAENTTKEQKQNTMTYIFTEDKLARGIGTALSWLGMNLKTFKPKDLDKGLEMACVDFKDSLKIKSMLEGLRNSVMGGGS